MKSCQIIQINSKGVKPVWLYWQGDTSLCSNWGFGCLFGCIRNRIADTVNWTGSALRYQQTPGIGRRLGKINQNLLGLEENKVVLTISIQVFLWIWFLGCVTTWRFGKVLLVEGMGIKSWEFVMLCLYSIALIAYYYYQPVGKWVLLSILALWFTVQFFCHWHYTLFGVSEKKLKEYNECLKKHFG